MNHNLQERMLQTRAALDADPRGVLIGSLPPATRNVGQLSGLPSDYLELLQVSDGIQCGEVVFYAADALNQHQSLTNWIAEGAERWLIVGQLSVQTIAMDRNTGALHLLNIRSGENDGFAYARLDRFLESVFGQDYLTLAGHEDDWYRLLVRLGFASDR